MGKKEEQRHNIVYPSLEQSRKGKNSSRRERKESYREEEIIISKGYFSVEGLPRGLKRIEEETRQMKEVKREGGGQVSSFLMGFRTDS